MSSVYVMVNTDEVPSILKEFVDIFTLFDSIRYIVGYCLPLKLYVEFYGNAEASRVIKAIKDDKEVELYKENHDLYKFKIAPLNVVAVNEHEFYNMIGSCQSPVENKNGVYKNRFFMRPSILRPSNELLNGNSDGSATRVALAKFRLNMNPHLIPIRLPDGLECYIRLNLAKHCQENYCTEEREFGFYHFREIQRDNTNVPSLRKTEKYRPNMAPKN